MKNNKKRAFRVLKALNALFPRETLISLKKK